MLSRLFIATLWLPAGKGLTSWILLVMFNYVLSVSHVVSWVGQMWYLIVLIHDLCGLTYFKWTMLLAITIHSFTKVCMS